MMEFMPAMNTTYHLHCYYHVEGLSLNKNTETILLGGFGVYFQKYALEEHKFSSFNHRGLQERMWKRCGKREAGQSGNNRTASCSLSKLPFNTGSGLEGNALGQNVTWEQEQCSCQSGRPQCPAVLLLQGFRIKRALKQLLAQVWVYFSLPLMFPKHCMAEELSSKHWKYVNKVLRWQYRLPDSSQAFWGPRGEKSGRQFCHLRRANHFFPKYQTYDPFQHVQPISLYAVHIQLHFNH